MGRHSREAAYWDSRVDMLTKGARFALSDNWEKRRNIVRFLLDYDFKGKSILEIGVGFGVTAHVLDCLHGDDDFPYVGTDISPAFIDYAMRAFGLEMFQARSDSLPFDDASFDCLFAFDVMEHIHPDDQEGTAKEINRVLKPTARVFINNPYRENPCGHDQEFEHGFTMWDLAGLAETLGMVVERIETHTISLGRPNQHRYQFIVLSRDGDFDTDEAVIANLETGMANWRTICEVHREIYHRFGKDNPELAGLLIEAQRASKKMDNKLKWYKSRENDNG